MDKRKTIRVSDDIYAKLEVLYEAEKGPTKLSFNAFCETVLWRFATGRLVSKAELLALVKELMDEAKDGPTRHMTVSHTRIRPAQSRGEAANE